MSKPVGIGSTIGQYRIDMLLGQGGMGVVYRALDTKLNRPVAVKFLSTEVADAEARRRFQREAQMASSLNHPHIVTVHDAGDWEGEQYVVTEFLDGGTLSTWASAESRSWRQCVEMISGVADGLATAHEAHILHRDIKPGNILVSKSGYAKLADFGLAKLDDSVAADDTFTRTGVVVGTLAYMSPEQALGRKCDSRSDIFSLGVVLYEMLAGKRPFDGKSAPDLLQQIVQGQAPPLPDSVPPALRDLVDKALEKEPADRYQSAREVAVDLRRIARRTESRTDVTGVSPAAPAPRRLRWGIPGAAILAIAAVAASLMFREETPNNSLRFSQLAPPAGGNFVVGVATVGGIAISPDGQTVAFGATVNGTTSLWLRSLNEPVARRVDGTNGVQHPFWSPDSKSIGFSRLGGMFRVDAAGGVPVPITQANTGLPVSGTWSEDGTILFFEGGTGLFTVPASGGKRERLLKDGAFPQMLPGGAFLYSSLNGGGGIYAATLKNPESGKLIVRGVFPGVYASGYLLWPNGNALLAQRFDPATLSLSGEPRKVLEPIANGSISDPILTVSTTGRLIYDAEGNDKQFAWFARTNQRLGSTGSPGSFQGFRLFDNGRRVLVGANAFKDRGLWLIDERGRPSLLMANIFNVNPTPSADGKSVVSAFPGEGIYRADVTGENRRLVTPSEKGDFRFPTDWSGDKLLFTVTSDIWWLRLSPDGTPAPGAQAAPYIQGPAIEGNARFAPGQDQRWFAYQSNESGRSEVYVQSFPAKGEKVSISNQGGVFPVWGPDGRELFYVSPDNKLMVVDVKFGQASVSATEPKEVFPLPPNDSFVTSSPYDTVDGQRFLVLSPVAPPTRPLQVVDDWPALLSGK